MNTNTKYFGSMDYHQQDILLLKEGLFGFEDFHEYLLIRFDPENPNLLCLQSLEEENLAFILVNPFLTMGDYRPRLTAEDMDLLKLNEDSEVTYYNLCVIREPLETSTVNLKCPLVINPQTRCARQIILDDYPLKHPLGYKKLL